MKTPDHIFDIALTRLLDGESVNAIVSDYPEYKEDLVSLLNVSEMGLNIPKLEVPRPYKRRLYAEKIVAQSWFWSAFRYSRVAAIPLAMLLVLLGGNKIVNATQASLPGDTLYTLKRAGENARLTLTRNPEKLAVIHVELLQNRINEVKQAAESGNDTAETAAIAELQSQTAKTFAEAGPLATANAISKQDSTLLDTLVAVNKQQKDVLESVQKTEDDDTTKTVASAALEDTKKSDQALAKIIATVNDQTMADMPNKISVTGNVTSSYNNQVIVEKNLFNIDDKTVITDINGQLTTAPKTLSGRITITGVRNQQGTLVAKQILLLPADTGIVKGATDTNTNSNTNTAATTTPKPIVKTVVPDIDQAPTDSVSSNPPQATGTFITEPNTPQYSE